MIPARKQSPAPQAVETARQRNSSYKSFMRITAIDLKRLADKLLNPETNPAEEIETIATLRTAVKDIDYWARSIRGDANPSSAFIV